MVNIILEDLKFKNENYNIFEDEAFVAIIKKIYVIIF